MSEVNDKILQELRASLAAMDDNEFNSIMDSFEKSHECGSTFGFDIDSALSSCVESCCETVKISMSIEPDYIFKDYPWAA